MNPPFFFLFLLLWQLCLPLVLRIAWPMPNYCHSTTDCSVTAYRTASINTHTHSSSAALQLPSPSPRCTDLATSWCYGRLSHHSHIPNVFFPPKALLWSLCACCRLQSWMTEQGTRRETYMLTGHPQQLCWSQLHTREDLKQEVVVLSDISKLMDDVMIRKVNNFTFFTS